MVVSDSNEASLSLSLGRSFTTGDNIGNLFYPGNMLPFTRGVGSACWGEGRGEDPSPTWRTGWEGGGSCGAHCPHAQATGGQRGWQNNLIMGGKFIQSHLNQKMKNDHPFSLHFSPQTCCFYLRELLKRNVRKYGEKTSQALTGNGLQSWSAFVIM